LPDFMEPANLRRHILSLNYPRDLDWLELATVREANSGAGHRALNYSGNVKTSLTVEIVIDFLKVLRIIETRCGGAG
jgi:hypothetical protein